ncbi:MAG: hypothetical protein M3Z05_05105 [Gemmatimonadota bacterium]|nr:hypothetical protein [Gemmatimonadota bacterium]
MITFGDMHPLGPLRSVTSRAASLSGRCGNVVLFLLLAAAPRAAKAQLTLSHTDDAAPVPQGALRFRVTTGWTRFDERFIAGGRRSLSDEVSSDSLGSAQLPYLVPIEQGLRTLAADPNARLSLGHLAAYSDARIVTTPIVFEYGLTRRLSIGVLVPIVQTRRNIAFGINKDSGANVGFVASRQRDSAAKMNALVYGGFKSASDSLATLVARCPTNPGAAGCAAVNANTADAAAAGAAARAFADALKAALGTDSSVTRIAPKTGGEFASDIRIRQGFVNVMVRKYLGASAGASTQVFTQSSPFSYIDLQGRNGVPGLLQSSVGGVDSLQTMNKLTPGGATVGVQFQVFDHFRMDSLARPRLQTRLAVGGGFKFEKLPQDSARTLGTIPAGNGSAVELHSAMDIITGQLGGTVAVRYTKYLSHTVNAPLVGDPALFWPVPVFGSALATAGSVAGLDLTPRLLIGSSFAFDGHYGFERTGATIYDRIAPSSCAICDGASVISTASRNAQRVGFGVRYSTVDAWQRGEQGTPIEVSFTHLQTITGDSGVARLQRDQVQVRLFIGVRSRK